MDKPLPKWRAFVRLWTVEFGLFEWACVKRALFSNWWLAAMNGFSLIAGMAAGWTLFRHPEWTSERQALATLMAAAVIPISAAVFVSIWRLAISPFLVCKDIEKERDEFRRVNAGLRETTISEGRKAARECFRKAAELLKSGDEDFPFRALCKADAHLLETNELVIEACNQLIAHEYDDPFAGLTEYVPETDYHSFLTWLHYNPNFNGRQGTEYLQAAEAWRIKQGYPTPSEDASLSMVFSKVLTRVPPLDRKKLKKGLKVSIVGLGIDDPAETTMTVNLMFINDGHTPRTVLSVAFRYQYPPGALAHGYFPVKAKRQDVDSNAALVLNPNTELATIYQGTFPPTLFKSDGATVSLLIAVSDGEGHARAKVIPVITILAGPEIGGISFLRQGAFPISMDEEPFMPL